MSSRHLWGDPDKHPAMTSLSPFCTQTLSQKPELWGHPEPLSPGWPALLIPGYKDLMTHSELQLLNQTQQKNPLSPVKFLFIFLLFDNVLAFRNYQDQPEVQIQRDLYGRILRPKEPVCPGWKPSALLAPANSRIQFPVCVVWSQVIKPSLQAAQEIETGSDTSGFRES